MYSKRIIAVLAAVSCAACAVSCTGRSGGGKVGSTDPAAVETSVQQETETAAATEAASAAENDINAYATVKEATPAMWKVTDENTGHELYMLGTMHMVTDDTFPLPDYIMDVYENCDGIAVEYDVNSVMSDFEQMKDFYAKLIYSDGTTVKDHISNETYEKAKAFMAENMFYNNMMDSYNAGFWETEIEVAAMMKMKNINEKGVDAAFLSLAEKDGKKIVNVESLDIQAKALNAATDDLADYMIKQVIDSTEDMSVYTESFARQYDLWASGDIDALDQSNVENEIPKELNDDYAAYLDVVLYGRNERMADKAEEFLKNGDNYFFMVGAAHFAGSRGVDDLLQQRGYKVERVA